MPVWEIPLPRGRLARAGEKPIILGIINCTPDSFSDGGAYPGHGDAIARGLEMLREGADWLDVGGESTRPGSRGVPAPVQAQRILPVIRGLRERTDAPISVDTQSPEVAALALDAGADIVNDVSAGRDPGWQRLLTEREVPFIWMHMKGTPLDMQDDPEYPEGVTRAVVDFFEERLHTLLRWGIDRSRCILDPGIGFGKRLQHNLELIRNMGMLCRLGRPVLLGASRKGFIDKVAGAPLADRDLGTVIVNAVALMRGAHALRVHNVAHTALLVKIFLAAGGAS